jgi:hypothetical protein
LLGWNVRLLTGTPVVEERSSRAPSGSARGGRHDRVGSCRASSHEVVHKVWIHRWMTNKKPARPCRATHMKDLRLTGGTTGGQTVSRDPGIACVTDGGNKGSRHAVRTRKSVDKGRRVPRHPVSVAAARPFPIAMDHSGVSSRGRNTVRCCRGSVRGAFPAFPGTESFRWGTTAVSVYVSSALHSMWMVLWISFKQV